jgi:hypothetical protein
MCAEWEGRGPVAGLSACGRRCAHAASVDYTAVVNLDSILTPQQVYQSTERVRTATILTGIQGTFKKPDRISVCR